jgi:beta-xylosidase/AraC-like DNA-binding protein
MAVLYLLDGKATCVLGDRRIHLEGQDLLAVNPGESHALTVQEPGRLCVLSIEESVFSGLLGGGARFFDLCSAHEDALQPTPMGIPPRGAVLKQAAPGTKPLVTGFERPRTDVRQKQAAVEQLRRQLRILLGGYLENGLRIGILEYQVFLRLVQTLSVSFAVPGNTAGKGVVGRPMAKADGRIEALLGMVHGHFREQITLSACAKQLFVSEAHLSREFKRVLGLPFRDYLNQVRLEAAKSELPDTDKSIARISFDNGFSSISMFNKTFAKAHGVTPQAYRKDAGARMEAQDRARREIEEQTAAELRASLFGDGQGAYTKRVAADVSASAPMHRYWQQVVSVGNAQDLLNPKIQAHLLLLQKELGFGFVRFWGVWDREMMIFPDDGYSRLNFSRLDDCLEFLLENNLRPFFQLGPIATRNLGNTVYSSVEHKYETPVFGFDADAWGGLVDALARHLCARYGAGEVGKWCFEMWCPGPWDKEWHHWFTVAHYTKFHRAIKKHISAAKVGGCEFFGFHHLDFISKYMHEWEKEGALPDFLSFSGFPYDALDGNELVWNPGADALSINVDGVLAHRAGIPVYITSWNITISNRNILNDSVFKGAYIIKNVIDLVGRVDLLGYYTASDAYSEYSDSSGLLYGGSGLLSKDGIPKPAYYAFHFLSKLGARLVSKGENHLVCWDGYGHVTVVYHNMKPLSPGALSPADPAKTEAGGAMVHEGGCLGAGIGGAVSGGGVNGGGVNGGGDMGAGGGLMDVGASATLRGDMAVQYDRMHAFFADEEYLDLHITLHSLPDGTYTIRTQSVHGESGSLLDEWMRFGSDIELTGTDLRYLRQVTAPRVSVRRLATVDGKLALELHVRPNEFGCVEVGRIS